MMPNIKVLVVEDEATTRMLVVGSLRKWGYDVAAAGDGEQAWEVVSKGDVRLVITDWDMPRLDGIGLCRRIRAEMPAQYIYVLLLTNYKDPEYVVQGLSAGADDFVSKPFNPLELRARMSVGGRILTLQDDLVAKNDELARVNGELARIAITDALTQLGNRRRFDEVLEQTHALSLRHGRPYGVLMADLDHFKAINDRFGHAVGDKVLADVAAAFRGATRNEDELFRYGGEEIVVLTREQTSAGLAALCDRLCAAARLVTIDGTNLSVTVSIGAALHDGLEQIEALGLLQRADEALYVAKGDGRNRYVLWQELSGRVFSSD